MSSADDHMNIDDQHIESTIGDVSATPPPPLRDDYTMEIDTSSLATSAAASSSSSSTDSSSNILLTPTINTNFLNASTATTATSSHSSTPTSNASTPKSASSQPEEKKSGSALPMSIDTSAIPSSTTASTTTTDDHQHSTSASQVQSMSGGVLMSWGCGFFNLLGFSDEINRPIPTRVESFKHPLISIAAGSAHALAVGADSSLYSWGTNDDGQLGLGDKSSHKGMNEVASLQTKMIVSAAAGYAHSLALTSGGEVYSFGLGEYGQLGLTMKNRPKNQPPDLSSHLHPALVRELGALTKIIAIACGENHSLALSSAGRVYSVGDGSRGALGLDLKKPAPTAPSKNTTVTTLDEVGGGSRVAVFSELTSLLPIPISAIAAGSHHSLFVSAGGTVYSCGDGSKGRLGYSLVTASGTHAIQSLPRRVLGDLEDKHVIAASAGHHYSLFLTQDHMVFSSGSNSNGELGFDPSVTFAVETPTRISTLPPIIQLSAGTTHALARDASNFIWSWGSNENSELGWQPALDPTIQIKRSSQPGLVALPDVYPHQHIVSVTAGSNTSYCVVGETILTAEVVNHSGLTSPTTQRLIPAPNSTPNSTITSPNKHQPTYQMFTPHTKFNFDTDVAMDIQEEKTAATSAVGLVHGTTSSVPQFIVPPTPTPIPLASFNYSHFSQLLRTKQFVPATNYLSYCFSSALILNASFLPLASSGGGSYIDTTLLEQVYQDVLKASLEFPKIQQTLTVAIQKLLTSMVLLLKQNRTPPKDLTAYRCIFICFQSPHLLHASMSETQLLTDIAFCLTRIPRDLTQTRIHNYLYSHIPLSLFHKRFIRILLQNVERRMSSALSGAPPTGRLRNSSEEIQSLITILDGIHTSVDRRQQQKLLESGPDRSETDSPPIPDSAWFLQVDKYMDLQTDLQNYVTRPPTSAQLPAFSFMRFPYLLSPTTKVAYLRIEFALSMQNQVIGSVMSGINPQFELTVRRQNLIEDTVNALNRYTTWELRRPLKVSFAGEAGEDQGGLSNEFFELALQQLFLPQYHLWEVRSEWKTYWFSSLPIDPSKASLYQIVGMLIGMCVYNGSSVQLNLPIWLYSQLLGLKPTLADLKSLDSQLAHSFEELLRFEGDVENTFCLTFEITVPDRTEEEIDAELLAVAQQNSTHLITPSSPIAPETKSSTSAPSPSPMVVDDTCAISTVATTTPDSSSSTAVIPAPPRRRVKNIPLLPGGEDIPVTQANKEQYVQLYLDYIFTTSVKDALQPLIEGFQSIVGRVRRVGGVGMGKLQVQSDSASMSLFTPTDLELLVVGKKELSFTDLRRGARYEGGYHAAHRTIQDFWSIVLDELSPKEQRLLLIFTTGSARAGVGGLEQVRLLIQRAGPDSDSLPTSSTCFHALLLPEYSSKEKMKAKLKLALQNATGFGLR